jgi:hypothetical protein
MTRVSSWRRLVVDATYRTTIAASTAAAAGVAHQLVDHPGGDAGIFQPGREGVAQVMGAVQVPGSSSTVARFDMGISPSAAIGITRRG